LLINTFVAAPREALQGVGLLAAGLPFYWFWSRKPGRMSGAQSSAKGSRKG
jgi:hypothetical protein